jgi:hypothetical protein
MRHIIDMLHLLGEGAKRGSDHKWLKLWVRDSPLHNVEKRIFGSRSQVSSVSCPAFKLNVSVVHASEVLERNHSIVKKILLGLI